MIYAIKYLSPASLISDAGVYAIGNNKVTIMDAMAIVNSIQIGIKLYEDFAAEFVKKYEN